MSQRNRAIIFGIAGVVLLVVGAVGMISTLSGDDDGDATAEGSVPDPSATTSTGVPTTQVSATTTPPPTTSSAPAPSTTLPATTTTTVAATTTTTGTTTTSTTMTTTTTTIALEAPEDFVNALIDAQAAGDIDFLTARLHPEVLARYGGAEPCRTYLESITFPVITLREINDPAPWDFATDGLVTTFPEAIGVEIQRVVDGETIIQELHIVYAGAELRWFTDCGEPV